MADDQSTETKRYISSRPGRMIIPEARYRTVLSGGEKVQEKYKPNPIEFTSGSYETDDPEEQEIIESQDDFGQSLETANIAPEASERELEEAAEEPQTLEEKLDAADSLEERKEILREAGQEDLAEQLGAFSNGEQDGGTSTAEGADEDDLDVIEGVSNKSDALDALGSIEDANEDVDFDVNTSDDVDTIAAAAKREGYTFDGWPR